MMEAISPIDGRYASKTKALSAYYSEAALIKYRVRIEIEYFLALTRLELPILNTFPKNRTDDLRNIYHNFSLEDAMVVKDIEKVTNHDVKAVEYFIKRQFDQLKLESFKEFVHFGLTSQDINNTAFPLLQKEAFQKVVIPGLDSLIQHLSLLADQWSAIPMLARTHGQPASPTRLGKELRVFVERLEKEVQKLSRIPGTAKFGGATGNLNAHLIAFPDTNWKTFADDLVASLGLLRQQTTTQIEHYDGLAEQFQCLSRIYTICIDLCRDIWTYVSMEYFKQKVVASEVGSSAMPHKVNPIDFENAEGNLGIARAICNHLANKLPISRLQRDLTDSTVLRNVGVPVAHGHIAVQSMIKGLNKLELNAAALEADLEENWAVVAEAYQNILRREGISEPYELLKAFTRGKSRLEKSDMHAFVDSLAVDESIKTEMKNVSPHNYLGYP